MNLGKPVINGVILATTCKGVSKTRTLEFGKHPRKDFFVRYGYYNRMGSEGADAEQTFGDDKDAAFARYEQIAYWMAFRRYTDEQRRRYLEDGTFPEEVEE